MGRPSSYTPEIAAKICERLIEGESLTQICRDDAMPSKFCILAWKQAIPEFATQYAHAREAQQDTLADKAREKAESATVADWQVARLQIDTIKWHASKVAPKQYGDKVAVEQSGPDGGPIPVTLEIDL